MPPPLVHASWNVLGRIPRHHLHAPVTQPSPAPFGMDQCWTPYGSPMDSGMTSMPRLMVNTNITGPPCLHHKSTPLVVVLPLGDPCHLLVHAPGWSMPPDGPCHLMVHAGCWYVGHVSWLILGAWYMYAEGYVGNFRGHGPCHFGGYAGEFQGAVVMLRAYAGKIGFSKGRYL